MPFSHVSQLSQQTATVLIPLSMAGRSQASGPWRFAQVAITIAAIGSALICVYQCLCIGLRQSTRKTVLVLWDAWRQFWPTMVGLLTVNVGLDSIIIYLDGDTSPYVPMSGFRYKIWVGSLSSLVFCLLMTRNNRRKINRLTGRFSYCSNETRGLAAVAQMIGGGRYGWLPRALAATDRFQMLPFSALSAKALSSSKATVEDEQRFVAAARKATLGKVDAFISHSWADDGVAKYNVLREWASAFEERHGREPMIWFDKACIDQNNIEVSLIGLPIYVRYVPPPHNPFRHCPPTLFNCGLAEP